MAISASDVKALRDQTGAGMMDCKNALKDAEGDLERAVEVLRERGLAKAGKRAGRATSEGAVAVAIEGGRAGIVELGCETDFVAKTDEFQQLASAIAAAVAEGGLRDVDAALAAPFEGGSVADKIQATIAKVGENIELKRVDAVEVEGVAGGYVHMGGKLGVIVGLATDKPGGALAQLARDLSMHVAAHDPTPIAIDRDAVPEETVASEERILRSQAEQSGKPPEVIEKMVAGRIHKFLKEVCLLDQGFVKDPEVSVGELVERAAADTGGDLRVERFVRFKLGEAGSG